MEVSVIVPSYNSARTIHDCLNSLINQDFNEDFEIIVADSSTDNTQNIVKENFPEVRLITFQNKTDPGTARNTGVINAKGKFVFFIDSDCIAPKNWIKNLISQYNGNNIAAVGGSVYPANPDNDYVGWAGFISEFRDFIPWLDSGLRGHIPTCNLSFEKKSFLDFGGFNSLLYPQEDLYFNHLLVKSGKEIYFRSDVTIQHWHRSDLIPFFKHQYNIGYVTSSVLQITDIEGSGLVRNKLLGIFATPILPFVKFSRTVMIFYKYKKDVLIKHKISTIIFFLGLWPWIFGFLKGIIKPRFKQTDLL